MSIRVLNARTGVVEIDNSYTPPTPQEVLAELRSRAEMTRAAFAVAACQAGLVSEADAESWAGGASVPASILAIIGGLPPDVMSDVEKLSARIDARTEGVIRRNSAMIEMLRTGLGLTHEQVDALFGIVAP